MHQRAGRHVKTHEIVARIQRNQKWNQAMLWSAQRVTHRTCSQRTQFCAMRACATLDYKQIAIEQRKCAEIYRELWTVYYEQTLSRHYKYKVIVFLELVDNENVDNDNIMKTKYPINIELLWLLFINIAVWNDWISKILFSIV